MQIDDRYRNDDGDGRYRIAVLWTMPDMHIAPSPDGPPPGRDPDRSSGRGAAHRVTDAADVRPMRHS